MKSISQQIFCAFCKLERKVYVKKSLSWTNVVLSLFSAFLLMYFVWQSLNPRAVLFFVGFLVAAEIFVRVRWRMSMPCPHCHFDPVLYKRDRSQAMLLVKTRLEEVKSSGSYLMKKNNPLQHLPVVRYNPETKETTIG